MAEETEESGKESVEKVNESRRRFLKTAAVGAAAAGFAMTAPSMLRGDSPLSGMLNPPPPSSNEPIVAYVGDAKSGEIVLMRGEHEVRVQDFGIVRWLLRTSSGL
jgi:hypothetical protein